MFWPKVIFNHCEKPKWNWVFVEPETKENSYRICLVGPSILSNYSYFTVFDCFWVVAKEFKKVYCIWNIILLIPMFHASDNLHTSIYCFLRFFLMHVNLLRYQFEIISIKISVYLWTMILNSYFISIWGWFVDWICEYFFYNNFYYGALCKIVFFWASFILEKFMELFRCCNLWYFGNILLQ